MTRKIASWILTHRLIVMGIIAVFTLFFAWEIRNVEVKTIFQDLLPQSHPYIKIHKKYEAQLGDPLKVFLMLQIKEGDIYNYETLKKVKQINDSLDSIPGVNHNQVYSIGSRKIKKITVTADSIFAEDFMKDVPHSKEEMEGFRKTLRNTNGVYGVWVSPNETSVLFTAAFIPELLDYNVLFKKINEIISTQSDSKHMIYAGGEPILTGWVYLYQKQVYGILGISFLVMCGLLYYYFRNLVGVVVPLSSGLLGIIWGLGFCGLMGYNLEPLSLVIPLLITARALSHSVQLTERYFECYHESKQVGPACIEASTSQYPPGMLGILCDVIGIYLIAVAPIPLIQKLAFLCGFWALGIIPTGLILTPILLSFFPPPKNISEIVDLNKGFTQKLLGWIAKVGYGRAAVITFIGAIPFTLITGWIALQVNIGDINPGTPILWKDSQYNVAIREMNKNFPGTEELYVIVKGEGAQSVSNPQFLRVLNSFQRHMEKNPMVTATLSIADLLPPIQQSVFGGYPKYEILPKVQDQCRQLLYILTGSSAPGDFNRYFSEDEDNSNVIIWFKDHMGNTIRSAIASVNDFIGTNRDDIAKAKVEFQLASGSIGILAAANEVVEKSQLLNLILVMSAVFVLCTLTYRSMVAALIIMIPLNLANLVTLTVMKVLGIGLNINTLPIVSVGVGTGIDYGIYLLSRLCEEYQKQGKYSFDTLLSSLKTTGKAIFFTNTTMCSGIIFFYFLSSLRFQAEMGLLLAIIMFMNMIGALFLIPSMVYVFKPKFLGKAKLLVKEG